MEGKLLCRGKILGKGLRGTGVIRKGAYPKMMENASSAINLGILQDFALNRKTNKKIHSVESIKIVLVKNPVRGRLIKRKIVL
jgi:hypothetical protein